MQAVLVNDAEDLKDTDFFFVVATEFCLCKYSISMALQQSLLDFCSPSRRMRWTGAIPML